MELTAVARNRRATENAMLVQAQELIAEEPHVSGAMPEPQEGSFEHQMTRSRNNRLALVVTVKAMHEREDAIRGLCEEIAR